MFHYIIFEDLMYEAIATCICLYASKFFQVSDDSLMLHVFLHQLYLGYLSLDILKPL